MFTNFSSSTETFQVGYDFGKTIESAVHVLLNDSPQRWREQLINKCTCRVSLLNFRKIEDYVTPCFPHQKYLKKNNHLTSVIDKVTNVLLNLSVAPLALNFVS